nr:MAG TPA: hypothetical protein [Caudoviricetes sp.]
MSILLFFRGEVSLPLLYSVSFSIKRRMAVTRFRIAAVRLTKLSGLALPPFFCLLTGVSPPF